jgi:hypothetical protein
MFIYTFSRNQLDKMCIYYEINKILEIGKIKEKGGELKN